MLRHLTNDFFSKSIEQLTQEEDNMSILEPSAPQTTEVTVLPTFEMLHNLTWLTTGTLDQMIQFIASPQQSAEWVHTFLMTHSYHTPAQNLLEALIGHFKAFPFKETEVNLVHMRIIRTILRWKSLPCYDFQAAGVENHQLLQEFIQMLRSNTNHPVASHWASELEQSVTMIPARYINSISSCNLRRPTSSMSGNRLSLLQIPAMDVAEQLTLIDHQLMCNIKLTELLRTNWSSSKKKKTLAPNVIEFAKRFNRVSTWAATEVLIAPTNELRVAVLDRLIKIEKELLKLKNFNGLMAIHAGLNFCEISRLKPLWKAMPERRTRIFEQVEELMSPLQNFTEYRNALSETTPPFIPFQSRLLGDLMSVEQMDLHTSTGAINFYKLSEIGQLLKLVELSQNACYPFPKMDAIQTFLKDDIFVLSKGVMFSISEQCLLSFEKVKKPSHRRKKSLS